MIDAEFVDKIQKLAERGVAPVTVPGENGTKLIVVGGQVIATVPPDTGFGELDVADFDSFVEAVGVLHEHANQAVISVSRDQCVFVADPKLPNQRATVRLAYDPTSAFSALCDWTENKRSVKSVNTLLKTSLLGSFDESLLSVFRQVEFSRAGTTVIGKSAHRDTLGKSVDQAVKSSAGELPEFILFRTPLYTNIPCSPIELMYLIDCDATNETIGILPCGDKLDSALRSTASELVSRLTTHFPELLVVAS